MSVSIQYLKADLRGRVHILECLAASPCTLDEILPGYPTGIGGANLMLKGFVEAGWVAYKKLGKRATDRRDCDTKFLAMRMAGFTSTAQFLYAVKEGRFELPKFVITGKGRAVLKRLKPCLEAGQIPL